MRTALIILAVLILLPPLAYLAFAAAVGRDQVWPALLGPVALPPVDFAAPPVVTTPNRWLTCPDGWCDGVRDAASPVYPVPLAHLRAAWSAVLAREAHATPLRPESTDGDDQLAYEFRTPVLRFPDTLTVQFVALDADSSSLAILSRSHYGQSDFGANQARVERLLGAVAARLAVQPAADG